MRRSLILSLFLSLGLLAASLGSAVSAAQVPVPEKTDQDKALASIKEIFSEQIASSKKPASKSKLALELIALGDATQDDPASQYVLYRVAKDLAATASDAETAFSAVDKMSDRFDVDAVALREDTLSRLGRSARTPRQRSAVVLLSLDEYELAVQESNLDVASRMLALAAKVAGGGRDAAMMTNIAKHKQQLASLRKELDALEEANKTLKSNPSDPLANSVVGAYHCFTKDDWAQGLSYLALGDNPTIKQLAVTEMGEPSSTDAMVALADGWWSVSEEDNVDGPKQSLQRHALDWYQKAIPKLTGLSKLKVERRIAEAQESLAASSKSDRIGSRSGNKGRSRKSNKITIDRGGARNPVGANTLEAQHKGNGKLLGGTGPAGSFLVGFRISTRPAFNIHCIASVRPIYQTNQGRLAVSPGLGQVTQAVQTVVAKDGYAVGKIHTREGMVLNGFHVTFMRVTRSGLDPSDSYTSPQLGASTGGFEMTHSSDGKMVVGLCAQGSRQMGLLTQLGLVMAP